VPEAVVLAVLRVAGRYALQLRDDSPTVASAGHWALFGGGIDGGETPQAAIRREILEELGLDVTAWRQLWRVRYYVPFWDEVVLHVIFTADVTDIWARHVLREGQASGLFAIDELPRPMEPIVTALLERYHEQEEPSPG
jgi:8-oxo-dGTP pyrophosphatase MutT (NUDIX family)